MADDMLQDALKKLGPDTPIVFKDKIGGDSAFHLPTIWGLLGIKVQKLGELKPVVEYAKGLLPPVPGENMWLPYLGETLDAGAATLYAFETIEGVRFAKGEQPEKKDGFEFNGPINDAQMRGWGIKLVDGRMSGFAALVGCAKSTEVAVKIVRELQSKGQLVFICSNRNGRNVADQLREANVEMGYDTFIVPFGSDIVSAIYALGFATRAALSFGGIEPGDYRRILLYNKFRCFAFVLALGPITDMEYAAAAGAINYGFPAFADTVIPNILPTGITKFEHVVSMPFDDIPGKDDLEKAERLVQRCIELRGIKLKIAKVPIPVAFGAAFEGEVVRKADLACEFGGKGGMCFEWLRMKKLDEVEDGKITVVGPDIDSFAVGSKNPLGIVVDVAGRKMQKDFESVLERQIHHMMNGAEGVSHQGQRDITWIRIHKNAVAKGLKLRHLGDILHTCLKNDFGAIVDKVQLTLYTEPNKVKELLDQARHG
jgi:acetyl-CoA synthase